MKVFLKKSGLILFLIFCSTHLTACKEKIAIVHDLQERDANEILVVLARHHISATKEKVEKNQTVTWNVKVESEDDMQARSILVANNLPKVRQGGLKGICQDAGLILTPKTEKCREILAYKGEIINSLESIPGVVSADVVLNIPDKEDFPDENMPTPRPTASVTIQYLKDSHGSTVLTEGKVQEFVANGVSGLDARDVTVILSVVETGLANPATAGNEGRDSDAQEVMVVGQNQNTTPDSQNTQSPESQETIQQDGNIEEMTSIGGLKMDEESAKRFKVVAVMFLGLFLLLSIAFIFVLLRMAKMRKQSPAKAKPLDDDELADQKLLEA